MGIYRLTTMLQPAANYDLVTLDAVKRSLRVTGTADDELLTDYIGDVSALINRWCNRTPQADEASFPIEVVSDLFFPERDAYPYQVPGGVQPLSLSHWPIAQIVRTPLLSAASAGDTVLAVNTSGLFVGMPIGGINSFPIGSLPPVGGPQSIPVGAVIDGIGTNTVTLNLPLTLPINAGTTIAFGLSVVQTDPPGNDELMIDGVDYKIDQPRGWLIRLDRFTRYPVVWPALQILVSYSGGYSPIPPDVQRAAIRWITQLWAMRQVEPNLRRWTQPGLGEKEYWVGGPPNSGAIPSDIVSILSPYRVAVVA